MWIKICANTNVDDAMLAAELGADAVGFVFAESARQVTVAEVAEIVPKLPGAIEKIGVFSSRDAEEIAGTVRETGLTGVQLHGGFDLELARTLGAQFSGKVTIIQVLHWKLNGDAAETAEFLSQLRAIAEERSLHRVLVDSKTDNAIGGTGKSFDWIAAGPAFDGASATKMIAAGGLHPENVARAIEELRPWGVDVASGVEESKGSKSPRKLKKFIDAVRGLGSR